MATGRIMAGMREDDLPDGLLDHLRLIRSRRVGAVTYHRLLEEHGSVAAALAALPGIARASGVEGYAVCPIPVALAELAAGRRAGARPLVFGDPLYPALLAELPDAPPLIWLLGDPGLLARPMVALVGARNASALGIRMARRLAAEIAEAGHVVVSGLARGIDTEAHLGALAQGTLAVQAGGIDVIYPEENAGLAGQIAEKGLRVSEQPPGLQPQARHFPQRNRIIAGLSAAVVVIEAAAKSGSLITARAALDQGRDVLAVPGHPFDARAAGCNILIRDGATLVRNAADIFEAIGAAAPPLRAGTQPGAAPGLPLPFVHVPPPEIRSLSQTARLHQQILDRLGPAPLAEDQLIRDLALAPAHLAPELLLLELDGKILRQPGGLLSRL